MPSSSFTPPKPSKDRPPPPPAAPQRDAPSVPAAPPKKSKTSVKPSLLRQSSLPATSSSLVMPVAEEWAGIAKRFDIPDINEGAAATAAGANVNSVQVTPTAATVPTPAMDE